MRLAGLRTDDSYETWPGEHLVWRGDGGERRPAVTQFFYARKRVATILFTDTNETEVVPVLELDPGGAGRSYYGVSFGQQVLLCDNNGAPPPEVPFLGQFQPIKDKSSEDTFHRMAEDCMAEPRNAYLPEGDPAAVDWFGEVVQLYLDGSCEVRLPSWDASPYGDQSSCKYSPRYRICPTCLAWTATKTHR